MKEKGKLDLDKYYTPKDIAAYCYSKTIEVLGECNITEMLEPSAGSGVFLGFNSAMVGYDIAPEHPDVIEQDYLKLEISYKKGRLIIGNPPYGRCLSLAQQFYKKSVQLGDYISFILPISQLNNTNSMYEFDLLYSEDLGKQNYSGRELHCVLNIYKRPEKGLNRRKKTVLKDIEIVRQDSKKYDSMQFDIRMCYWGNGTAGKILQDGERYAGEFKIKIHNVEHYEEIKSYIESFDWNGYIGGIAMKKIQKFHIVDKLLEEFPYLQ